MKNLYETATATEIKQRIANLKPDSARQWGTMTPAQVLAHLSVGLELAVGDMRPPRMFLGRIFGGFAKKRVFGDESPLARNTPTAKFFVIADDRDFNAEQTKLTRLVERFTTAGPARCTTHPHTFFGNLTPDEWAVLMYKHADHHLRQFGA